MIRDIVKDPLFLAQKSQPATEADVEIVEDLLDTMESHFESNGCVGMAANMIGKRKCIIVFLEGLTENMMMNPSIVSASEPYETEEGCLCFTGTRKVKRYQRIRVKWQDEHMKWHKTECTGYTAQIIQHEIDHCNGILV